MRSVEIAGRDVATDGVRLAERLRSCGATVLQATPASWRLLLDSGWKGDRAFDHSLRRRSPHPRPRRPIARRGSHRVEPLRADGNDRLVDPLRSRGGQRPRADRPTRGEHPRYVLDAKLRPVPVGVAGELYLGGQGLAHGYHDRPELTAERFIADPYAKDAGARMYRTGDLARYRPDGVLECLGRVDNQVKIRGFRIELGEIEAALARATRRSRRRRSRRVTTSRAKSALVGYVVSRGVATPEAELRGWLRERLPDYMIPSAFVNLDALPLTPNGKIDRNALPDPTPEQAGSNGPLTPPSGPVEEASPRSGEMFWGAHNGWQARQFFRPRRPFPARDEHARACS